MVELFIRIKRAELRTSRASVSAYKIYMYIKEQKNNGNER